jgi:hypothetical protein
VVSTRYEYNRLLTERCCELRCTHLHPSLSPLIACSSIWSSSSVLSSSFPPSLFPHLCFLSSYFCLLPVSPRNASPSFFLHRISLFTHIYPPSNLNKSTLPFTCTPQRQGMVGNGPSVLVSVGEYCNFVTFSYGFVATAVTSVFRPCKARRGHWIVFFQVSNQLKLLNLLISYQTKHYIALILQRVAREIVFQTAIFIQENLSTFEPVPFRIVKGIYLGFVVIFLSWLFNYCLFFLLFLVGWDRVSWWCAHYWPIVPAADDRWWWLWRNRWNEDWQGKPKYSEKTFPRATLSTTNPTWLDPGLNPGRRGGKSATIFLLLLVG